MLIKSAHPQLVELHFDALALGWQKRLALLLSPVKTFDDLLHVDLALQSRLDALLLLGEAGCEKFTQSLNEALTRGEFFALSCYALARRDRDQIDTCLALARSLPHLHEPLCAAMDWQDDLSCVDVWAALLPPTERLRMLASFGWWIAGDPLRIESEYVRLGTLEPSSALIKAELALIQGIGDRRMARAAVPYLDHDASDVRLAAASVLVTLGEPALGASGLAVLIALVIDGAELPAIRESALHTIALHASMQAEPLLDMEWACTPGPLRRIALLARGWIGRTAALPELIACFDHPQEARVAALAFSLITGSEPVRDGWSQLAPAPASLPDEGDQLAEIDVDQALPWPSAIRCRDWWKSASGRFDPYTRYLYGQPIKPGHMVRLLRQAPLVVRRLAAAHLQRHMSGAQFPIHLPAMRQLKRFHGLTTEN